MSDDFPKSDTKMPESGPKMNGPWEVLSDDIAYENPWIKIHHHQVVHPDGSDGQYGVVRFANRAIGVLPIDQDGYVWLVGQHRFPFNAYSWELPEGGCPNGENPLDGAKRELREETGFTAQGWISLLDFNISNSVTDESASCFIAYDLEAGENAPDPSEELAIKRIKFNYLLQEVLDGKISDSLTIIIVLLVQQLALSGRLPIKLCQHILFRKTP